MKGKALPSMRWRSRLNSDIEPLFSFGENLKNLTTLGVGGASESIARPRKERDLRLLLAFCLREGLPLWVLGGGSNVLIKDEGLPGVTILTSLMNGIFWEERNDSVSVFAESGTLLTRVLAIALKRGWSGLEFSAGIPGTVGGALVGNAGAEGYSMGDVTRSVRIVERNCRMIEKRRSEIQFSYRFSSLGVDDSIISACQFELKRSSVAVVANRVREFLSKRKSQPKRVKTAGCIFKNPEGWSAGKLLDETGCKGLRCGDASVSFLHANFFENHGNATSEDFFSLINNCRERVLNKTGIFLETEIRFMGNGLHAQKDA